MLGLASGLTQIFEFLDTNMLVSPTQNSGFRGLDQCKPQREKFASQWNVGYRLSASHVKVVQ